VDVGKGEVANGVAATGEPVEMARLTLIHPKSTERHDVTVSNRSRREPWSRLGQWWRCRI